MVPLDTAARVAEIKKQLVQLNQRHRKAIDASDWEACAKLQEQIARKLDEVKALMQTSGPV
jgi:protein-arginine kinase activator protein McsA